MYLFGKMPTIVRAAWLSSLLFSGVVYGDAQLDSDAGPLPYDCVINPSMVADLGSGVPGVLDSVRVDRADYVRAGDVVAELESGVEVASRDLAKVRAEKNAEIDLRRANAAYGKRKYSRSEDLFKRKVLSTNDMDERKTEADVSAIQLRQAYDNKELAELELARAEQVLKRRTIASPISGVVMERFKTVGEYVDDQPVVRIAQLDPLYIEVFVPVEHLGEVRPGLKADITAEAVPNSQWLATVDRVDRVADVASGTYGVRLTLPNPQFKVPAGLRCNLTFRSGDGVPLADTSWPPPAVVDEAPTADAPSEPEPATVAARASSVAADDVEATTAAVDQGLAEQPEPSEQASDALGDETLVNAIDVPPLLESPASDASLPLCLQLGPFGDETEAQTDARKLRADGMQVRLQSETVTKLVGYLVVTKGLDGAADARALIKRLQASGITDHHYPGARNGRHTVALGLYSTPDAAERRVAQLEKLGISTRIKRSYRHLPVYTLLVSGTSKDAAHSELDTHQVAVDPNLCETLAGR